MRLIDSRRGYMGCGHPNRRVSTLRYVISPLQGHFFYARLCTQGLGPVLGCFALTGHLGGWEAKVDG